MTTPEFLTTLARSSAQAGVLALLILAAQAVFRRQLSPRWRCALWLLVAARLLVPVSLNSAASLFNLVPPLARPARPEPVERADTVAALPTPRTADSLSAPVGQLAELVSAPSDPSRVSDPAYSPVTSAPAAALVPPALSLSNRSPLSARLAPFNWPRLLFALWLAGALSMLACLLLSTVVLARRFRPARRVDDPEIAALLLSAQRRLGLVAAPLPIYECDRLGSPALYGCWRPRLLLPAGFAQKFSPAELGYVFLHELAHVRRRDLPVNWLLSLLSAVHWFNPLVWLAFARWRADRELACDALALEAAGPGHNTAYGQTILRLLEGFLPQPLTPGLVGILEDKRLLRQRISAIASFTPRRRWPVLALALTAALALVGLTDAQVAAPTTPAPTANKPTVAPSAVSPVPVASPSIAAVVPAVETTAPSSATLTPASPELSGRSASTPPPAFLLSEVKSQTDGSPDVGELMTRVTSNWIAAYQLVSEDPARALNAQGGLEAVRPATGGIIQDSSIASALSVALNQPSSREKIGNGSYEAHLLQDRGPPGGPYPDGAFAPGIIFPLLWLKSTSGGPDLIYVYKQPPYKVIVEWPKLYTASEYLQAKGETFLISGTALDQNGQPLANTALSLRIEPLGWARATTDAKGAFTFKLPRSWEQATSIAILGGNEMQRLMRSQVQPLKLVRGQENKLAEPLRLNPPAAKTTETPTPPIPAAPSAASSATLTAPTSEPRPNVVERLSKVFRFAVDPTEARAVALPYSRGMGVSRRQVDAQPALPTFLVIPSYGRLRFPAESLAKGTFQYFVGTSAQCYIYLFINPSTDEAVVDVNVQGLDSKTQPPSNFSFASSGGNGNEANRILSTLAQLAGLDEVRMGSFEPGYFTFGSPAPYGPGQGDAIWLRSMSGSTDLVYPLPRRSPGSAHLPYGVQEKTLYKADKFNSLLVTANGNAAAPSAVSPAPAASSASAPTTLPAATPSQPASPLRFATGIEPDNARQLISEQLKVMPSTVSQLKGVDPDSLRTRSPLGHYSLNAPGGELPANTKPGEIPTVTPKPLTLYYTVESSAKPVAELSIWMKEGSVPYASGKLVLSTYQAIPAALIALAAMDRVKAGVYEPRLLDIGSPPRPVIWLKSVSGGADLIYSLTVAGYGLKSNTLYSVDEFLATVLPPLKQQLGGPGRGRRGNP